ncbi:MAG: PTS lactose/cellobiose transporter subunit IIA [Atopostipes suicloacalis]|nr:PTS lactose/cellobiose transporter subunit IIA [Atopostipes suicloacalis]
MEDIEKISFKIISAVGSAKSYFIEAMNHANKSEFKKARESIEKGEELRIEGHKTHFGLIQQEEAGKSTEVTLILMHAEDQLMAAETIKLMAEELIRNYERIDQLEQKIN